MLDLNRRRFLGNAVALALSSPAAAKDKEAYRFRTVDAEIEMTIEFHDGYASRGFWFGEQLSKRNYCLSAGGEEGQLFGRISRFARDCPLPRAVQVPAGGGARPT